mmetsp:Transcript_18226/g.52335  ORF Transcript_18226/g.52335 Transcript_18226/m.52335 type:complete len:249 (+) Transcript_18226:401-1147(+)
MSTRAIRPQICSRCLLALSRRAAKPARASALATRPLRSVVASVESAPASGALPDSGVNPRSPDSARPRSPSTSVHDGALEGLSALALALTPKPTVLGTNCEWSMSALEKSSPAWGTAKLLETRSARLASGARLHRAEAGASFAVPLLVFNGPRLPYWKRIINSGSTLLRFKTRYSSCAELYIESYLPPASVLGNPLYSLLVKNTSPTITRHSATNCAGLPAPPSPSSTLVRSDSSVEYRENVAGKGTL